MLCDKLGMCGSHLLDDKTEDDLRNIALVSSPEQITLQSPPSATLIQRERGPVAK